jgi:hypothetical protein
MTNLELESLFLYSLGFHTAGSKRDYVSSLLLLLQHFSQEPERRKWGGAQAP